MALPTRRRRPTPAAAAPASPEPAEVPRPRAVRASGPRSWTPVLLARAAHGRQGLLTAGGLAVAAALAGRPAREIGLVLVTVLVGQTILGWHNDLVDRDRDRRHALPGKPLADGRLDPGSTWYALSVAVLLLVPLSVANGVRAGVVYDVSVVLGVLGNLALRRGLLSWLPWAAAFALYPAFLSLGGWGGATSGPAPNPAMVAVSALLGVGVHLLCSVWGLVPDHEDGWRTIPLRIGLHLGAGRLLSLATLWIGACLVVLAFLGTYQGLAA